MISPKMQNKYCPICKKHTLHEVKKVSVSKKKRLMASGQRRFKRKMKGFGSFPKSNPGDRAKPTRKLDITYKCKTCNKSHNIGKGFRIKKFEQTR
ncbi:MAG: 50S ribosomal protein L44e [Nanoarchaeota archaeon]|nr:50S ribosomal protein L44e [Nanoarchaeota archaeon]MBU4072436.1 50S ribosomal protein L44e [Candidatus Thermoplasmatota archaeon]